MNESTQTLHLTTHSTEETIAAGRKIAQLLRQYAQMRKMFKGLGKGNVLQRRAMGMMSGMKGLGR